MGLQMHGWVEVWTEDSHQGWEAVINVYPLVARVNDLFTLVFGIMPSGQQAASELHPLAANRGIPHDASPEAHEWDPVEFPYSEYVGHTWVLWSELERTPWGQGVFPNGKPLPDNWRTLLDITSRLGKQYDAERVRLVVWFG